LFSKSGSKVARGGARGSEDGSFSIIAKDVSISGHIGAGNDLQINGLVEGDVKCGRLSIGETGRVAGAITCEEIQVAGTVDGPITATKVELLGTAQVSGDVGYQDLRIELGAKISGKLHWVQDRGLKLVASEQTA